MRNPLAFAPVAALATLLVAGCGSSGSSYYPSPDLAMPGSGGDLAMPPGGADLAMPPVQDMAMQQQVMDFAMPGPTCNDNAQNGNETDVDCGGNRCGPCAVGQKCAQNVDCVTNLCSAGRCQQMPMQKNAVGGSCGGANDCSGPSPSCSAKVLSGNAANGYCTNTPCQNNNDCGFQGFCPINEGVNFCLGACQDKNQCQKINGDNRCFYWNNSTGACLPSANSECDPTSGLACGNTGDCLRQGPDSVGICLTGCQFNAACPADKHGNPQACYFFNQKLDVNGNPSGDVFQGLTCYQINGGSALGDPCNFLNDCDVGLECNFFKVGNAGKVCKQLCRDGQNDCSMGGACTDAFKLGNKFVVGAIGLCL